MIKANGYGCGLEPVARTLVNAGCKTFFVADLGEARRVRSFAQEPAIYVLNGLLPGTASAYADINVRPVIGSLVELAEWDAFCATNQWHGGAALHVDTGMNRLGISADEAAALAPRIRAENHGITLLMSHLVCSELPEHPLNEKQIQLFRDVRLLYRGIPGSLANSSGIFLGSGAHCDVVRPGAALFGVNPTPGRSNPMRPAVELHAHVVQVRTVPKGETIGYNAALDCQTRDPRCCCYSRLCRRLSAGGERHRRGARRRSHRCRNTLPACRTRFHGSSGDRHHRPP